MFGYKEHAFENATSLCLDMLVIRRRTPNDQQRRWPTCQCLGKGTCLVQVEEVNATPNLAIFFLDRHNVGESSWVLMGFMDPTSRSFCIFFLISTSSSAQKFLGACFTNLVLSLVFTLCVTNYESSFGI